MLNTKSNFTGVLSVEYDENPYLYIDNFNKSQDVIYDDTIKSNLAISYDAVKFVLSNPDLFSTKPLSERAEPVMRGKVLAQMVGEEHKIKRKIIVRKLSGRFLKDNYEPMLEGLCNSLLDEILKKDQFDFICDFGDKFALLSVFNLIGIGSGDISWVMERLNMIAKFATGFNLSEEEKSLAVSASKELEFLILNLINLKKSNPENDLISYVIKQNDSLMSESEIVALSLNILLAASEPVAKVLTNCIYHLYRNPKILKLFVNEEYDVNDIVQESLRITPPVHLIPRQAEKDVLIGNVMIKKGEVVFSLIPSANRDDKYFSAPNLFEPSRKFKNHLSYGTGMHACIGAQFSNMQLTLALKKLIPILVGYREVMPPKFHGVYVRGTNRYLLKRV